LASSAKGGTDEGVECGEFVGVWKNNTVVLSSHVGLYTLAIHATAVVDVCSCGFTTNKGDGLNCRVVAQEVDGVHGAVNDVKSAVWNTSFLYKLSNQHSSSWITL
jgi:hypothetical protein